MKIKKFSDFVFEAQFDKNKLRRVSRLFGILFGKKFGSTFQFFTLETYKKMGTKGMGIRLINDNAQMIRLNFNRDSISYGFGNQDRETLVIDGIDFWEQGNSDFGQPTLSCTFPKACNVVQIYKKLSLLLSQGKRGKFKYEDLKETNESIQEAVRELGSKYDRQAFIDKKGADVDSKKTPFEEYLKANGLEQEYSDFLVEIKAGKPETNSTQENIQQVQVDFDEHVYANPETVFRDIEDMTEFIAKGGSKALIVCGMGGIGKCIDEETLIATPNGHIKAKDIKVGDRVFTPKNTIATVTEVYPQEELHECYEVELSDGRKIVADDEQLFNVKLNSLKQDSNYGKFRNIPLKKIREVFEEQKPHLTNLRGSHIFFPQSEAIEYSQKEVTLDPYFLGLLLGDGCFRSESCVTFSNKSKETLDWIRNYLEDNFNEYQLKESSEKDFRITKKDYNPKGKTREQNKNLIKEEIQKLGLFGTNSHSKFIPNDYKFNTIENRLELLRGLVDTDGYISKNGVSSYCTVSYELAKDFCELIWSLGGLARLKEKNIKYKDSIKIAYDITFTLPFKLGNVAKTNTLKVQRYQKRIEGREFFKKVSIKEIRPVGLRKTICFLLDDEDHLFLTSDYIPVHNTYGIKQKLKLLLGDEGLKWTYHSGMKVSANAFYKTIYTERDRCVVLDEADSFLKNEEIVMMLKPALDTDGDHQLEYAIRTKPMNGLSNTEVRKYCQEVDAELAAGGSLIFSNSNKLADGEAIIPSKYFFDGQMIFISNMRAKQIDQALKSRALFIDVYLCAQDVFKRIGDIMQAKYPNMTREQIDAELEKLGANNAKQENVVYMTPELARKHNQFSIRTATIGFALRDAGIANWSWLAQMYA